MGRLRTSSTCASCGVSTTDIRTRICRVTSRECCSITKRSRLKGAESVRWQNYSIGISGWDAQGVAKHMFTRFKLHAISQSMW